ncbi:MAG: hypothetical protein L0221_18405 [Chloroflexi bacterium]|nr:hypothetical protein [Chloroflexota bacterium]
MAEWRFPAPIAICLAALVAATACSTTGPSAAATPAGTAGPSPAPAIATSTPTSAPEATAEPAPTVGPVTLSQPWATADLTDVRTGDRFRIADLVASGRVVFLETMAIWCSNCRRQQQDVIVALQGLPSDRVTWIGIDVDPSEIAGDLAAYSKDHGFDWPFVVAGRDLARSLADEFGDQVLSPPSTPIVVVGTDGTVTLTEFGHKSIERILALAAEHGA